MKQTARLPGASPEKEPTAGVRLPQKPDKRRIRGDRIKSRWLALFKCWTQGDSFRLGE